MTNTVLFALVVFLIFANLAYFSVRRWRQFVSTENIKHVTTKEILADLPVKMMIPGGTVAVFSLCQKDTRAVPYCWAMLSFPQDGNDAVLWMIYTREQYRGKGYAKKLIKVLQSRYDSIYTEYEKGIVNSAGVRLCMACGFTLKSQMFRNVPPELSWRKEK